MPLIYILITLLTILAYKVIGVIKGAFKGTFGGNVNVSRRGNRISGLVYA
jgi:hypothetical protein